MPLPQTAWAQEVQFIDHGKVDWEQVKRTRYFCYQRFHYTYSGPIRNLQHHLVVLPNEKHGDQILHDQDLTVSPYPAAARQRIDAFGNIIWDFDIARIDHEVAFEVLMTIDRSVPMLPSSPVKRDQIEKYLRPTRLTEIDEQIRTIASEMASKWPDHAERAEQISDWVAGALRYGSGATDVSTPAAHALHVGQGLCQDYAHLMIAICRASQLPARYVSGHMLGEGGSHAWVEVMLPGKDSNAFEAVAFDPTNRRHPNLGYTRVAIGRDYRDVAPTSGTFTGQHSGRLSFHKRAGLVRVEYQNGDVLEAS